MGYRIKTVSELTGVPRATILAWERRYGFTSPERQPNGYREYSEIDIDRIRAVKRAVDAGQAPSEAVRHLRTGPPPEAASVNPALPDRLAAELLRFQRPDGPALALAGIPYARQLRETYFPLLRRIGDGWHAGTVTVAQEHFASAWCRDQMVAMLLQVESGPRRGPLVVAACYPGERHELGLLGLCVRLAASGYRVSFLGADVPLDDLCATVRALRPALVCVSVVMQVAVPELMAFTHALRTAAPPSTEVAIGGAAVLSADLPVVPGVRWGQIPDSDAPTRKG